MTRILLTKYYPEKEIENYFGDAYLVEAKNFITTKNVSLNRIRAELNPNCTHHIITSKRGAEQVSQLPVKGDFYVVGNSAYQELNKVGKSVKIKANNAHELVKEIIRLEVSKTEFQYFCSSIRLPTIQNELEKNGFTVNEIITYTTESKEVELEKEYDAYVFFSPSGVKSFFLQYQIPKKARIFAIGETTANALKHNTNREIYVPNKSTKKALIKLIKETIHD